MKLLGILGAATLGLLLLSGTLAGEPAPGQDRAALVAHGESAGLPAWHPPVAGHPQQDGARHPALPEGHPPIPKELVCPATGAVAKPGSVPRNARPPVEGLVRI
jgi:hypothetical protein